MCFKTLNPKFEISRSNFMKDAKNKVNFRDFYRECNFLWALFVSDTYPMDHTDRTEQVCNIQYFGILSVYLEKVSFCKSKNHQILSFFSELTALTNRTCKQMTSGA